MKKILVVDDQLGWRNFNVQAIREILGENVEIQTAYSAQQGYNLILENLIEPFDCIFTDMQMEDDYEPKMAGEWLIGQLKALPQYLNTKVIIISASIKSKIIAETYGVEYMPKSVAVASQEGYKAILAS